MTKISECAQEQLERLWMISEENLSVPSLLNAPKEEFAELISMRLVELKGEIVRFNPDRQARGSHGDLPPPPRRAPVHRCTGYRIGLDRRARLQPGARIIRWS